MTARALALFGTTEQATPTRKLTAGRLSAVLDAGNLRDIRCDGVEVIRGISFLLRDVEWGTAGVEILDLAISEGQRGFSVTYRAKCNGDSGFAYDARIEGLASGQLVFRAEGASARDFVTNRVGFVVLHPLQGVAGRPMTIEHVDGTTETVIMPELISPDQPAFAIRMLTHEAAPGLTVSCRLEGDIFEMEDQRNWTDASFKTYVRPVALPRPFKLAAGERIVQSVTITMAGNASAGSVDAGTAPLAIGTRIGVAPDIALGIDPSRSSGQLATLLSALGPQRLVARLDVREMVGGDALAGLETIRAALGAKLTLELILPARDADRELGDIAKPAAAASLAVDAVVPTGAYDLKMRPSNSAPADAVAPADLVAAARRTFPCAAIGGGVFTGFPEFNRNPPTDEADFVTHTTSAIVHAADDRSVMQTIEALPYVFSSARAHADGLPYRIGPSGIGLRINPAGSRTAANPQAIRLAMATADPRQDGLFGAAWTLGYAVEAAWEDVNEIALADAGGPFGIVGEDGGLRPLFHVLRGLARLSGAPMRSVTGVPQGIAALAAEAGGGSELWLANLTPAAIAVTIEGSWRAALLDLDTVEAARLDPAVLDRLHPAPNPLPLGPYAVARVVI